MQINTIFKYRRLWMSFAILWVIFFHSSLIFSSTVLSDIKMFGYGGVDIFLFASGIGCFSSISKDNDILGFLKRRFFRIMPTYWCFIIIWIAAVMCIDRISVNAVIGNIFCVQSITGNDGDFNWYMSAVWIMYLLTPLFASVIDRINSWQKFFGCVLLLILISVPFWFSYDYIIIVTRLPIFFIGMFFAKKGKENVAISKKAVIAMLAAAVLGIILLLFCYMYFPDYMWNCGLWWYPFILITPGLCVGLSVIAYAAEKNRIGKNIVKFLSLPGNYTFEIYLVHILLFYILEPGKFMSLLSIQSQNLYSLIVILLIIPAVFILKKYTSAVCKLFQKITHH